MRHFYVIVNPDKDREFRLTGRIADYIERKGGICQIGHVKVRGSGEGQGRYTDVSQIPQGTEAVLVVGGDGTLIQASRDLKDRKLPLMGINMGTLGYLSEVEASDVEETLEHLFADEFFIEERMLLRGEIVRDGKVCYEDMALNDIILSRLGGPRILHYRIQVNGQFLHEYDADAVLVSTPTGSTAYNLSAGGPIVSPEASLFVVTPVCAHSLNSRSIILPENAEIEIAVKDDRAVQNGWQVAFDGVACEDVRPDDVIRIVRSERRTHLIKLSKVSFLETLRKKMQNH